MIAVARSLRSLILGETWTIPLGIAAAVLIAVLLRSLVSDHVWHEAGGFVLAGLVATTLVSSLRRPSAARGSSGGEPRSGFRSGQ